MVPKPNTIVDPWTVMVEPLYAVLADGAVPATTCPNRQTVRAELSAVDVVQHVHEVYVLVVKVAWTGDSRQGVEDHRDNQ